MRKVRSEDAPEENPPVSPRRSPTNAEQWELHNALEMELAGDLEARELLHEELDSQYREYTL